MSRHNTLFGESDYDSSIAIDKEYLFGYICKVNYENRSELFISAILIDQSFLLRDNEWNLLWTQRSCQSDSAFPSAVSIVDVQPLTTDDIESIPWPSTYNSRTFLPTWA